MIERDRVRQRDDPLGWRCSLFGIAPTTLANSDPVSDRKCRHLIPEADHHSGTFKSRNERELHWVEATPLICIDEVHPCGFHFDQDLVPRGSRCVDITDCEDLGSPGLVNLYSAHRYVLLHAVRHDTNFDEDLFGSERYDRKAIQKALGANRERNCDSSFSGGEPARDFNGGESPVGGPIRPASHQGTDTRSQEGSSRTSDRRQQLQDSVIGSRRSRISTPRATRF